MIEELKGYCSDCRLSTYRSPQQCDITQKAADEICAAREVLEGH